MLIWYEILIIVVMIMLNALFVGYEMALASISRSRLALLVNLRKKGAADAAYMKDKMESSLAVLQLGITLVGAFAAATGGAGVEQVFAPYLERTWHVSGLLADIYALILFIVPLTFCMVVFGELVPKIFSLHNKEAVLLMLSPAMRFLSKVTYPVVIILEKISSTISGFWSGVWKKKFSMEGKQELYELIAAASLARSSRLLGAREEKIVLSAAQLATRPVREILIPVQDMSTLYAEDNLSDAFLKAHLDMHTRFPVVQEEGNIQTVIGYVNFKDILLAMKTNPSESTVKSILRPIARVDEEMPLSQLLEKMMQEKAHILIVASRDQKVRGLVTMEDIIEELVGEIEDEFDRPLTHVQTYGSAWIMGGGVTMNVVMSTLGITVTDNMKETGLLTLEDWCARKINGRPKGGEIIEADGIFVVARKFRRKRLAEAVVGRVEAAHG